MRSSQKGFSLVEIMVALVIGMISMIVIMQVFYVSEGRKRTTTGGADAQANGAIAFYMVERDTKMAGWGIDSAVYSDCSTVFNYCDGSDECGGGPGNVRFASVLVTDGANGGPDTITAQYFANPTLDTFRFPSSTTIRRAMPQSSSELDVGSVAGCAAGDMVLISDGAANCTLMQVTHVQGEALKIQHNPGTSAPYNPPANYQNANNWPAYGIGAKLSCFKRPSNGPMFQRSYSINTTSRALQRSDNTVNPVAANEVVTPEIMDLQVQYGTALANTQVVTAWTSATGSFVTPTLVDWKRIKAVRVALVARSTQYEKPEGSAGCTTTTQAMVNTWSTWATFNTANYPRDWMCYRYKVFETVIPLRNVLWANI